MSTKTLIQRLAAATQESNMTAEELKSFEGLLRNNLDRADQKSRNALILFSTLTTVWVLLRISEVQKVSVIGMELHNIPLLLVVLPALAAFAYYQFVCMEGFVALIDETLRLCYRQSLPSLNKEKLTELLTVPTIHHIEASIRNMEPPSSCLKRVSLIWELILGLLLISAPILMLLWMLYVSTSQHSVALAWRIISPAIVIILILRSLLLFFQWARTVLI